jgi:hypothetical protein
MNGSPFVVKWLKERYSTMPMPTKNEPDLIDVQNLCSELGESYGVVVYFTCRVRADAVEVIGKTVGAPYTKDTEAEHVALYRVPLRNGRSMASTFYTLAFDLWLQHDGGGATAAARGPTHDWRGRVEVPKRRR